MQHESQHRKIHKRNVKYISPSHKHIQIINLGLQCKCKAVKVCYLYILPIKHEGKILEWDTTEQPHQQCAQNMRYYNKENSIPYRRYIRQ